MKFIHTADIHLDSPLHRLEAYEGAPVEEIRQASRRAFENLIDLALEEAVDFVLIAGDLFDGDWKDYNTGLYFVSQMRRLNEGGIPVFIVAGNHDAEGKMTRSLPYPDNVHVFSSRKPETKIIEELSVALHGQSFARPAVMDNIVNQYPEPLPGHFNIGVLHTSLNGRPGHDNYAPCTLEDLKNRGYDYWALGHVHQAERALDDPPVVFPGCLQGRHIRETGAKGCVLVSVEEGAPPVMESRPLDVIRWETIDVDLTGAQTEQTCRDQLAADLRTIVRRHEPLPVAARVLFTGEPARRVHEKIAGDLEYWREAVRSAALAWCGERVWVEKVKVKTRPAATTAGGGKTSGPIRELEDLVASLKTDDASLLELGTELAELFQKLPVDYRQGEEVLQPDDLQSLIGLVDQAGAVLRAELTKEASDDENP